MKLSNIQKIAVICFIIGLLIIIILYNNLNETDKNTVNFISIFGTFLSFFGIVFAFLQLESIKEINTNTHKEVKASISRINDILSISELSKGVKIIQEIQTSIQNKKYELSLIRMKDLKYILIQTKHNSKLIEYTKKEEYENSIINLSIDINNVSDSILKPNKTVNYSKVNSNLEGLSTKISELENKLKFIEK
ncbi:hypothetical protein [Tenacibaculum finnmarkense]|uniref:hypothetical protein n=1 Tax=Tenacibaculum finnmarkense TaxID=2781243 RepID=UPI001E59C68C|nr:hypothetical protein [Tenacibaculum finnmarkense]MCD8413700.1 hypothetical protein [Tenacibaculum finnmarkense genomovar ulcerans]